MFPQVQPPTDAGMALEVLELQPDAMTLSEAVRDERGRAVDMRLTYMNAQARAGQPDAGDAIGGLCSALWPSMVANGSFAACMRALDTGEPQSGDFMWEDEETYEPAGYEWKAVRIGSDTLLWVLRDCTERLRHARAVQRSEAQFRSTFVDAPVGMALLAADGTVHAANPALERMLGLERDALVGRSIDATVAEGEAPIAPADLLPALRQAGSALSFERRLRHAGGRDVVAEVSVAAMGARADGDQQLIAHVQDVSAEARARQELAHAALHDPLTDLPNRALLVRRLAEALARGRRRGTRAALLFVDVDHFKQINDSRGHGGGDAVLQEIARRLTSAVRADDTVARFGGDEFVLLCGDLAADRWLTEAETICGRIYAALEAPVLLEDADVTVSLSIGVSSADGDSAVEDVLRDADLALYRAKADGRGRWRLGADGGSSCG
ncbi:MAG TPA: sensor domain-containing diguanylate cyclase [Capillimicrobium sp.]